MSTRHNPYAGTKRKNPQPQKETVPEGTAKEILLWVGDDVDKALEAVEYEKSQEKPRKTLITSLEAIVDNG